MFRTIRPTFLFHSRPYTKYVDRHRTAKAIRQKFLDYFINENNHNFIKSSPVVPFCDPTVAFVNAGMNQFKGVFLGTQQPPFRKVANSQKCIRVGGKHNDLNVVGSDGYHHTFFEMLGNWSFGDYFKKEACELAWKLLTEEYKIHPSRLYVTYFSGDPKMGIEADMETKEIWKSIGVTEDRILPFSTKDNFWEMGATGPCGPCTEIHVDHVTTRNRAGFVNKGLHDLTELWNIVFIQYNRKSNQSIHFLPEKHVDTGMGFERLTALLQGKISNYDTDNFSYLLKAINKNCSNVPEYGGKFGENDWNNLDTSYRILADHARMVTVCLGDAMIPEQNQKLRRILRRAFLLSENVFKKPKGLLKELSNYVIENLGPVYTELERNVKHIHQIIDYEEEVYAAVRKSAAEEWSKLGKTHPKILSLDVNETPSLVAGYREIKNSNATYINDKLGFKLYDTYGLDEEAIAKLATVLGLKFDRVGLRNELEAAKWRSKEQSAFGGGHLQEVLAAEKVPKTDVSSIYSYRKQEGRYVFDILDVEVLKIFKNSEPVEEVEPETYCSLLLDKTNLYTEAGGQASDKGTILFHEYVFEVIDTQNCHGYVLHKGFLRAHPEYRVQAGDRGALYVDPDHRLKSMRNHTAVHLLNALVKNAKGATCQKSSKVTENYFNLDLGIFGDKFTMEEMYSIERTAQKLIEDKIPVSVSEIDSQKLSNLDGVTLVPGEVYPENGIRVVEIHQKGEDGFLSREPCCGTHVLNTGDLLDICIVVSKALGRGTVSLYGVTGERAKVARANGLEFLDNVEKFAKSVGDNMDKPDMLNDTIAALKAQLNYNVEDSHILPVVVKQQCLEIMNKISKVIKESEKKNLKEFVEIEMKNALQSNIQKTRNNQKYLVHYLRSSLVLENVPLQKATKFCPDIPVLVISYSDNTVKARCCVPEKLKNKSFNAEKWLQETVAAVFKCKTMSSKGQDPRVECNMRPRKIKQDDWDALLQESLEVARKYIEKHLLTST